MLRGIAKMTTLIRAGLPIIALIGAACLWPASPSGQTPDQGQTLFNEHCANCHGATAEGRSAPDLTNAHWQADRTDAQIEAAIRDGVPFPHGAAEARRVLACDCGCSCSAHPRDRSSYSTWEINIFDVEGPCPDPGAIRLLPARHDAPRGSGAALRIASRPRQYRCDPAAPRQ